MEDFEDTHVIHKPINLQFSSSQQELELLEEEEALSLCDLPLNGMSFKAQSRRSSLSSEAADSHFFEFLNDVVPDLCPADEIFFSGKLIPLLFNKDQNQIKIQTNPFSGSNNPNTRLSRSDPITGLQSPVSRSSSAGYTPRNPRRSMVIRNSRSLNYCRNLHRISSSDVLPAPETAAKRTTTTATTKPRWYSVVFGTVRVPPEMELSDMRSRQIRRNSTVTMFPPPSATAAYGGGDRSSGKVSWRILRALSCKDRRSVSVTTSLGVPQAT